jgi:tetratricopeptide (TPR) repeat protein
MSVRSLYLGPSRRTILGAGPRVPSLNLTCRLVLVLAWLGVASLPRSQAQQTVPLLNPATDSDSREDSPVEKTFREAFDLRDKGDLDGAIAKATDILQQDPDDVRAYVLRGDLYAKKKQWSHAEQDFTAALKIDEENTSAKFDLAEIKLMQKQYAAARPGFAALVDYGDLGDLAAYKVFLCDLYGGDEAAAAKELAAFDQVESKPSYYYANAGWKLYHKKTDDARIFLDYAARTYSPETNHNYASTLKELGYLPLPPR